MGKDEQVTLEEFKYSYAVSSPSDQERLIQSVHMYPGKFKPEVREYVNYIFKKLYELYSFNEVTKEEVLYDKRYKNRKLIQSEYTVLNGFKIYDAVGNEIAQGIFDYQKNVKLLQIHYVELLNPIKGSFGEILKSLIYHKFGEDVTLRMV